MSPRTRKMMEVMASVLEGRSPTAGEQVAAPGPVLHTGQNPRGTDGTFRGRAIAIESASHGGAP